MPRLLPAFCDCGKPATTRNVAKERVCESCRELERLARERKGRYAKGEVRVSDLEHVKQEKRILNFKELFDDSPIIAPDAIARLDSMLAVGLQKAVDRILASGVEPNSDALLAGSHL